MKKRLLVIGLAFLLLGWGKGLCQELESVEMKYIPRTLCTLNYGSLDNQIGILPEGDIEGEIGEGPSSDFIVDSEENIYIGDIVNRKIKVFDKKGNYLFDIKTKLGGASFRVDENRNIYVTKQIGIDECQIEKYDSQGKFLYTIDYDPYEHIYEHKKKVARAPSLEIAKEIAKIPRFSGSPLLLDSKGNEYKIHYTMNPTWTKAEKIEIETRDSTGETIGSFTFFSDKTKKPLQKAPVSCTPSIDIKIPDYKELKYGLGIDFMDRSGNIYASGLARREKPLILWEGYSWGCNRKLYINSDRIVYKYDSQGRFITQIRFPFVPAAVQAGNNSYIVDPSGNIYCLQFHKDSMDVVKYEWKPIK